MTSLLDSSAHFEERCLKLGFNDGFVTALNTAGVNCLSRLAFAVGQPGQAIQDGDVTNFLTQVLARAPTLAETTNLKHLTFEAHTYMVASLRQQIEHTDDTVPRKVAFAERSQRMEMLRTQLAGLSISGEYEPSHGLLDKCCAMYEQNSIKWLEPSVCVSRSLEVQGATKSRELTLERGSLILKNEDKQTCATDSEIKLHYAFTRRAVAFAFARMMSYQQHCEWERFLFESLHRAVPPGYQKAGLSQVVSCDKAAWARLATLNTTVREAADGTFPLGLALLALRHDPSITLFLSPLARAPVSTKPFVQRPGPYQEREQRQQGKSKGKGKGKTKAPPMPAELRGKYHKTSSNEPICFAYNTVAGCSHSDTVKPGERCPKGLHVCCEPRCQQPHSLQQHK